MSKPRYKQGRVLSLVATVRLIEEGQFIFVRGKIYHHGWSQNWQLREIIKNVNRGWVREAIKI